MKNVVEIVLERPSLSTLVDLLKAADLVGTLKNLYNATVFAPTNYAFSQLNPKVVQDLLKPQNKAALRQVLLTHVVDHQLLYKANEIWDKNQVVAMSGAVLEFHIQMNALFVMSPRSSAKVSTTDIQADERVVVHVIDGVLLP